MKLSDLFPGSAHVRDMGLASADDARVWDFARQHGFIIVSKDDDFHQRSFLHGHPPKVIGVLLGNCATRVVARILRDSVPAIASFEQDSDSPYLGLTSG